MLLEFVDHCISQHRVEAGIGVAPTQGCGCEAGVQGCIPCGEERGKRGGTRGASRHGNCQQLVVTEG
jgi:hypothetical protein